MLKIEANNEIYDFWAHFHPKSTFDPQNIKKWVFQNMTFLGHLDLRRAQNRDFYVFDLFLPSQLKKFRERA